MKAPDGNKLAILNALNQGGFVSGQALGEKLGISRAAVSKHIKTLQEMGLDIFKVTGKGYCLNSQVGLLNKTQIDQHYKALGDNTANVEVHPIIDSTNSELMRRIQAKTELGSGTVIVALLLLIPCLVFYHSVEYCLFHHVIPLLALVAYFWKILLQYCY